MIAQANPFHRIDVYLMEVIAVFVPRVFALTMASTALAGIFYRLCVAFVAGDHIHLATLNFSTHPDPKGLMMARKDRWAQIIKATTTGIATIGLAVHFMDVMAIFDHLMPLAMGATNVL